MTDTINQTGAAGAILLVATKFKAFKDDVLKKRVATDADINKLKAFTGYQDDLDLVTKVTEILGE